MARQPERDQLEALSFICCECGHPLARTESGFLACPNGHGRLTDDADDPRDYQQPDDERDGFDRWAGEELPPAA
jgi:hypothetical protein